MSDEGKKRRWGKSRPRDNVNVINKDDLEDTLHKLAEEAKERKAKAIITSQNTNDTFKPTSFTDIDLQQPQLMSDELLVEALKKISVPIPVYSDGSPSRERLLYLYRTYVLPQPQRSKQQWERLRRFRGKRKNNGELIKSGKEDDYWENGEVMEVEASENGGISSKKRMMSSESEDKDLVPPIKRLLIKSPSAEAVPSGTPTSTTSTPAHSTTVIKRSSTSAPSAVNSAPNTDANETVDRSKITWP